MLNEGTAGLARSSIFIQHSTLNICLMTIASVADIRAHFPALDRLHNGKSVAYFDAPGGTQVPRVVAEAMSDYLFHHNANTHWLYPTSEETDAIVERSREAAADLLNADRAEIIF